MREITREKKWKIVRHNFRENTKLFLQEVSNSRAYSYKHDHAYASRSYDTPRLDVANDEISIREVSKQKLKIW